MSTRIRLLLAPVIAMLLAGATTASPAVAIQGASVGSPGVGPTLVARDLDGKPFQLSEAIRNGPVIITFWATWCKPCRRELPELQKLVESFGERGLQVVAVNGDGPVDAAKVRPYIRARKFDFVVIPDPDGEIRRNFQVEVFPTTFVLDPSGEVRHRQVGYRQGDEQKVRALIEKILAAVPPAAGGVKP